MNQAPPLALEMRPAAERESELMAALPALVRAAQAVPAFAQTLQGVDANRINTRAALAALPVTHKHALFERQQASRDSDVFGGFSALGWRSQQALRGARHVFQIPWPSGS
jgi:phenylacetate-CoA ligase